MVTPSDPSDTILPGSGNTPRNSVDLLPRFFRTDDNKKFLQSTIDQLTQPGTVKKVNGYIGRQTAKSVQSADVYVEAIDPQRQAYQLEPAAIIQDELNNVQFFKDYIDYINHISLHGGIVDNHEPITRQEFYSWNPHICWDKLSNFQEYYWMPDGPPIVDIAGVANITEFLGNLEFTTADDVVIASGMKVRFPDLVDGTQYAVGEWFVDGVGTSITLSTAVSEPTILTGQTQDYVVINRASPDRNPWAQSNRWFHQDTIARSAAAAGVPVELDQNTRARRPIIEFSPGIKLANFGYRPMQAVDLVDTVTRDVFQTINGSFGYNVDGTDLVSGMRLLVLADTNPQVNNRIYEIQISESGAYPRISLQLVDESLVVENASVFVRSGSLLSSACFWFDGSTWVRAQQKLGVNQSPLFDVVDSNKVSFANYEDSTFTGTKIFSYKVGSGPNDLVLGFPISYRDINNIGDITFSFDFQKDSFSYNAGTVVNQSAIDAGFFVVVDDQFAVSYENGWITSSVANTQPVVRVFKESELTNNFPVDVFDNATSLTDLRVLVFVNGLRLDPADYQLVAASSQLVVSLSASVQLTDIVTLECYSSARKNDAGYYKIPINLQQNPLNEKLTEFTLGQVTEHVSSIVQNAEQFTGKFPGTSNLRELPKATVQLGTKIVQHSSPLNLSLYHFGKDSANIMKAIEYAKSEYAAFKRSFINLASTSGIDASPRQHVDFVLSQLAEGKPTTDSFYLSDMFASSSPIATHHVSTAGQTAFPLVNSFVSNTPSNTAVLVYVDGVLALINRDYTVSDTQNSIVFTSPLQGLLPVDIFEYASTDGSFCPPTPTKLGIFPKYEPMKFVDSTCSPEFLEYEVTSVSTSTFSLPQYGVYSATDVTVLLETRTPDLQTISRSALVLGSDFTVTEEVNNTLTVEILVPLLEFSLVSIGVPPIVIQGHDGAITVAFNDYRDELLLELEKRIYNNLKVDYDPQVFDIKSLVPGNGRSTDLTNSQFNEILSPMFYSWLAAGVNADYTDYQGYDELNRKSFNLQEFYTAEGDSVPGFWRGVYRWFFDTDRPHLCPWECLGESVKPQWWDSTYGPAPYTSDNLVMWDDIRLGIVRLPTGPVTRATAARPILALQAPVDNAGKLISPIDTQYITGTVRSTGKWEFGDVAPVEAAWRRSSDYNFSLLQGLILMAPARMFGAFFDRSRIQRTLADQLVYAETGTRIQLDSLSIPSTVLDNTRVYSAGLVNYVVEFISSNSHSKVVEYKSDLLQLTNKLGAKLAGFTSKAKFKLMLDSKSPTSGETKFVPEENFDISLNTSSPIRSVVYSGMIITKHDSGYEISGYNREFPYFKFYQWTQTGETITAGGISELYSEWTPSELYVAGKVVFYAGKFFRATATHQATQFSISNFTPLSKLPVVGGQSAVLRTSWNKADVRTLAYSTRLQSIQDVVDLMQGYNAYLIDQGFVFDEFNKETNSVSNWISSINEFLFWTTQAWPVGSVLSLSPAASKLVLKTSRSVVQDIFNPSFGYKVFRVDGNSLNANYLSVYRGTNEFSIESTSDVHGIYGATFFLVQKEHVLTLDSRTLFNDVIYDLATGYKQDRLRVIGYMSRDWTGGFDIPGFVFDEARVVQWEPWTDYHNGDVVKHKEYFYSATSFVQGSAEFDSTAWVALSEKPTPQLIPNWDYKANQFLDFYELDSSNFDVEQQRIAQHLIGYQPRAYLQDIINDDVSQYKFYQGMIVEKGTQNVLNKLFDVVSNEDSTSISFVEEWAVRTGQFGAVDTFRDVELKLDESHFTINPQPIEVYSQLSSLNDRTYQIPITQVYNQTQQSQLFDAPSVTQNMLRTPGFLTYSDVEHHVSTLTDLIGTPVTDIAVGDKIWCGFEGREWNVYAFRELTSQVTGATYLYNRVTFNVNTMTSGSITSTAGSTVLIPRGVLKFNIQVVRPNLPVGTDGTGDFTGFELGNTVFENDTTTFDSKFEYRIRAVETSFTTAGSNSVEMMSDTVSSVTLDAYLAVPRSFVIEVDKVNKDTDAVEHLTGTEIVVTFDAPAFIPGDVAGVTFHPLVSGFSKVIDATPTTLTIERLVNDWATPFVPGNIKLNAFVSIKDRYASNSAKLVARPDPTLITEAYLYNTVTNEIILKLDTVDASSGKIPAIANAEIRYKSYTDPASYNTGAAADAGQAWSNSQVGLVWWDLTRARFLENQLGVSPASRAIYWNQLYSSAGIDICEWVASKFTPAEWNSLTGTPRGIALGISGTARSTYSVSSTVDSVSGALASTYYYWVVNKESAPDTLGRTLSAQELSQLIADPVSYGYPCLAILGNNSLALVNVNRLILGTTTSLRIRYRTTLIQEAPVHSEWKIISEAPTTVIPQGIEAKWFDSIIGVDDAGQPVPHPALPSNLRYGIGNSPSQSMFVNRVEALKQIVGSVNNSMKDMLVSESVDLLPLLTAEPAPALTNPGEWDITVDTNADLSNVITRPLTTASLTPVIVGGKLVDVIVVNPGSGYVVAPIVDVAGVGSDADVVVTIDAGAIDSVTIVNAGTGYSNSTILTVRPFTALVQSDSEFYNKWSIRQWNEVKSSWDVVKVQSHDVTKFWDYVDWFAPGYDQYLKTDVVVDNVFLLASTEIAVGKLVTARYFGTGGWATFKKLSTNLVAEYSPENYEMVARASGTIQFSPDLYETDTVSSRFDELFFDQFLFDNYPINEIRIILNFIKDALFVDDRYQEYLRLFFSSVRYALSEQLYVDWIFKTSFVKATHYAGTLSQPATFNPIPVSSFEDYINEVKPYRTKVRTYTSSYNTVETGRIAVSDFDLPPVIAGDLSSAAVPVTVSPTGVISSTSDVIDMQPWKDWKDNFGYIISGIQVLNSGEGYTSAPTVVISGDSGATAVATISSGKVVSIELTSAGQPVRARPAITFTGGGGVDAAATITLSNGVIRSNRVNLKFDRIAKGPILESIVVTETPVDNLALVGDGTTRTFSLKFAPAEKLSYRGNATPVVLVDGAALASSAFSLAAVVSNVNDSIMYSGELTFVTAPVAAAEIEVTYVKSHVHMSATDRINFFYTPGVGQLGKGTEAMPDYSQLMTGVDYGGNIIAGPGFTTTASWGTSGWDTPGALWDSSEDVIFHSVVVTDDAIRSYTLPSIPQAGTKIHVILNGVRVDYDPEFESSDPAKMQVFVGDGTTDFVIIPANIILVNGDTLVFEQEPSVSMFETVVSAGDLTTVLGSYSSATGLTPEEIVIDGAGFVTPLTSFAPEEVVPGQVVDTLSISVFTANVDNTQILHGFMQFKDMLNRVQYKRLNEAKATALTAPLLQADTSITVADGTTLFAPQPQDPGVIMINGERIEYRSIALVGAGPEAILSDLVRSTLGTGMPDEHPIGTRVVDISSDETVPYADSETSLQTVVPFGSCYTRTVGVEQQLVVAAEYSGRLTIGSIININNVTVYPPVVITARLTSWVENIGSERVYTTDVVLPEILETVGFVGEETSTVATTTMFAGLSPTDISLHGVDVFNVFDGGYRLRKYNYVKSDADGRTIVETGTTTPVEFVDYSFAVDNSSISLTVPSKNKVLLVKRAGQIWTGDNLTLSNSTTDPAVFITAVGSFFPYP